MINDAILAFGAAHGDELFDDFGNGVGIRKNSSGARAATEGAHAAHDKLGFFARQARDEGLFERQQRIAALQHEAGFGKVKRDDGDVFGVDVLPDIELGPIRERKDAQAFARMNARVENVPEFGTLIARVPLAALIAKRKDAFFGAGTFFVAARAPDSGIETAVAQTVEKRGGFECAATALGAPVEGIGAFVEGGAVGVDDQVEAEFGGVAITKLDHFLEFVAGIDVQKREGNGAGKEGFLREAQQDGGIFADGIKQDGALAFGDNFAHDVNALRFELLEVTAGGHYRKDSIPSM